jgi:hypothetical protein
MGLWPEGNLPPPVKIVGNKQTAWDSLPLPEQVTRRARELIIESVKRSVAKLEKAREYRRRQPKSTRKVQRTYTARRRAPYSEYLRAAHVYKSRKEAAKRLGVNYDTIKFHMNLADKLGYAPWP